jgi:hypothetical protein
MVTVSFGGKGNDTLLVETSIGEKGKGLLLVETGMAPNKNMCFAKTYEYVFKTLSIT